MEKHFDKIMAVISLLASGMIIYTVFFGKVHRVFWGLFMILFFFGIVSAFSKIREDGKEMLKSKVEKSDNEE
ncbi:hypothetical protein KSF73_16760 [Burkholderiaceae bacterium DAT-1]|nr:hypothetical protein [Burkholderiaceae bacterium DAT-1]